MERKKGENATIFLSRETPFLISLLAINRLASIHFSPLLGVQIPSTQREVDQFRLDYRNEFGNEVSILRFLRTLRSRSSIRPREADWRKSCRENLSRPRISRLESNFRDVRGLHALYPLPVVTSRASPLLSLSLFTDRVSAVSACQKRRYTVFASRINFLTSTVYRLVLLLLLLSL